MFRSYFTKTFFILLLLKLICGSIFGSHYIVNGFIPFIDKFINQGINPYDYFYSIKNIVFPYPGAMLLIVSPAFGLFNIFIKDLSENIHLSLLAIRIPILLADTLIYLVLCKLLPSKEKKVLWLYFASPILFYINYFHGQLDVIPTSILFLSIYFLHIKKDLISYLFLGIGIAVKTHLSIALPFFLIFSLRQKKTMKEILLSLIIPIAVFVLFNLPFATKSYFLTVFNNQEQQRLFFTVFSYQYKELSLLLAPAALLICFYIFASNKKLNFDSLILMLGLAFTILIALVPPMQGWFYWSIPLFTYFLIKYKDSRLLSFLMMNIFFMMFFVFTKDSDIFESSMITFKNLSNIPRPFDFLVLHGLNAPLFQNLLFTFLQISVAVNAFWSYKLGIFYNNQYIERQKAFMLGIGGDSGVGKSTLTEGLSDLIGEKQIVILNGDDSHKWERGNKNWQLFTHLDPKANYIHKDVEHLYALAEGNTIERVTYNHKNGKFSNSTKIEKNQFILFQGLHPFFLEKMREIYDLKIFIDAKNNLKEKWKISRDIRERGYSNTKVKKEIERRRIDSLKFILPQKKLADWIIEYYQVKKVICVKYTFFNSLSVDNLVKELSEINGIKIKHIYQDTKIQTINIEGKINKRNISEIAYKLYPNLNELIGSNPEFRENTEGLNQLFFINYLNYYYEVSEGKYIKK